MASAQRIACAGAAKRARIPSPVDLDEDAVVAGQEPPDVDVELVEDGAPLAVARLGGAHGRVHDVGEEHRGEQACGGVRRRARPVTNSSISSTMESNSPVQGRRSGPGW